MLGRIARGLGTAASLAIDLVQGNVLDWIALRRGSAEPREMDPPPEPARATLSVDPPEPPPGGRELRS